MVFIRNGPPSGGLILFGFLVCGVDSKDLQDERYKSRLCLPAALHAHTITSDKYQVNSLTSSGPLLYVFSIFGINSEVT